MKFSAADGRSQLRSGYALPTSRATIGDPYRPTPAERHSSFAANWSGNRSQLSRPFALKDQRTASAYIFCAICPALGKETGLVLPYCNTEGMELNLQEIALAVQPGAHAVLFVDQAGWHVTAKLNVPENMTLIPLPSKSPERNPVENIWQYRRDNWLSNCIFKSYSDIVDHCCFSWNKLVERPWLIMSIGMRRWAHRLGY